MFQCSMSAESAVDYIMRELSYNCGHAPCIISIFNAASYLIRSFMILLDMITITVAGYF